MDTSSIKDYLKPAYDSYNRENLRLLSDVCLYLGFLSIIASIVTWFTASRENRAYGERFGIFIGLWVPSFFILSNRLSRKADELIEVKEDEN
ncbi:MAG: hypothetical protein KGR46_06415 [Verrucomicrobia bacterium]|jgi:hypothetical protein|nr:hypothetical protein [Verrucomicrobiota bacterium]